jgi:hypothetical protein
MLVTVTNTSGGDLNAPDTYTSGSGPSGIVATGGNVVDPLPYPFGHIGTLADTATKQLPMHNRDWRYKRVPWLPMEPSKEWQVMVQAGKVTLAVATETDNRDEEEIFIDAVL